MLCNILQTIKIQKLRLHMYNFVLYRFLHATVNILFSPHFLIENMLTVQNMSSFIMMSIGLSVSLLINLLLIVCGILLCRYSLMHVK